MKHFLWSLIALCCINSTVVKGQDSTAYKWEVSGKRIQDKIYELTFSTTGNSKWQLYGANESIADVPSVELQFGDSSIEIKKPFKESGNSSITLPLKYMKGLLPLPSPFSSAAPCRPTC
jgi:thiol:disulfide interchange protein DsbD